MKLKQVIAHITLTAAIIVGSQDQGIQNILEALIAIAFLTTLVYLLTESDRLPDEKPKPSTPKPIIISATLQCTLLIYFSHPISAVLLGLLFLFIDVVKNLEGK